MNTTDLRAMLERATKGPWVVHDGCSWRRISSIPADHGYRDGDVLRPTKANDGHPDLSAADGRCEDNLALIVALRNAAPLLLDVVEACVAEDDARLAFDAFMSDRVHDDDAWRKVNEDLDAACLARIKVVRAWREAKEGA